MMLLNTIKVSQRYSLETAPCVVDSVPWAKVLNKANVNKRYLFLKPTKFLKLAKFSLKLINFVIPAQAGIQASNVLSFVATLKIGFKFTIKNDSSELNIITA